MERSDVVNGTSGKILVAAIRITMPTAESESRPLGLLNKFFDRILMNY